MSKRMYPFPYKTVANDLTLEVSSISIENITIQSPNTYPTYTLTLPPNDGLPGQILSTDGTGVLSWVNDISGGTVTSVSATVPAWLSVTVTNPTTTPAIAITGTSTGTGTVTVLQDAPTLLNTVTMTGQIHMNRTSGNGDAIRIHNAQSAPQENYIEIGHNSNNYNHAHFGHNYLINNDPGNYAYIKTNGRQFMFSGAANFTLPITEGTNGQSLITDGLGVTSWTDRVSAVSATVPSFMSVTVTNPNTTPAIAISATSTGTGAVVLETSPTIATPTLNNYATVAALGGSNDSGTLIVRGGTDVYISKYKSGATGVLNNAFMITTNPANPLNTFFYSQGSSVGIFSQSPQETLDVQGSIRASNFIRFNNVNVYPGSSGVLSLYLPTTTGTSGQVLTSTGSGTAMTWTTPTTGTLTAVTATSPIVSSGGTTPDISLSTVPTTLGGTGLTTVGTNGQVLASNGTTLQYVTLPTPVTSVTATSPILSSGGATPDLSLSTVPTTLGGTGLTTVGTNGQVLTSNGTTLSWQTPSTSGGSVTSVSAGTMPASMTMTITSPTTTPIINISATTTGSGSFVREQFPIFNTQTSIGAPTAGEGYLQHICVSNANYIQSGLSAVSGSAAPLLFTTIGATSEWMRITSTGQVGIGTSTPAQKLHLVGGRFRISDSVDTVIEMVAAAFTNYLYTASVNGNLIFDVGNRDHLIYCAKLWVIDNIPGGLEKGTINFSDDNHAIIGRYDHNDLNIGSMNYYAYGEHRFLNNGLIGAQTLKMTITTSGNVGIGTTTPAQKLDVIGRIQSENVSGDVGCIQLKTDFYTNYIFTNSASGLFADVNPSFVIRSTPAAAYSRVAAFLAPANTFRTYIDLGKSTTIYEGAYIGYDLGGTSGNFIIGHHGTPVVTQIEFDSSGKLTVPGNVGIGTSTPTQLLDVAGTITARRSTDCAVFLAPEVSGAAGVEVRGIGNVAYLDLTAATPSPGADYDMRISRTNGSTHTNFEMTVAGGGGYVFDRTIRAPNFTTNGIQTFTYASGTFTPRIAMFYTSDNTVYECNSAPPGKDNIAITYSVQTGLWVRVGNLVTVNMEIQYSQTYAGITFDMTNLNIVAVIPEAACNPSTLGAVGLTGYPSRIADRFVDNFQMNYWISNTAYAPGGTICEVQLRRDNTHNMLPWDPTNKSGQRLNITTSYYVNQ